MKLAIFILFICLISLCIACKVKPGFANEELQQPTANDSPINRYTNTLTTQLSPVKIEIKPNAIIRIISADRELNDSTSDDAIITRCKEWSLSSTAITTIFKHGRPISMHDFHYLYYVLPCEVKGIVQIDSSMYKYSVNAGSFFTISNRDTTCYFECNSPRCGKFFLMAGEDTEQ
ncbi:hypothetical protein AB6805_29435 [Chitinophaga sp. RCC_12]|uniref:hypothetical protein n=1 Tax=Chitinophaga sp. RCC_12 TaxID=3239226 RepID=UPI003524BDA5